MATLPKLASVGALRSPAIVLVLQVGFLLACRVDEGDVAPDHVVSDSAGIQLVHNLEGAIDTTTSTLVERLRIGVMDGAEHEQFYRILGIAVSDNGTLYVSNGGSSSIRVFSNQGEFLREIGRKGNGPGEFDLPAAAVLWQDTLYVRDVGSSGRMRAAIFDTTGNLLATTRSLLLDGSLVELQAGTSRGWLVSHLRFMRKGPPAVAGQESRDTAAIRLLDLKQLPRLALMSAAEVDSALTSVRHYERRRMFHMMSGEGLVMNPPLFEPWPRHSFGQDGLLHVSHSWPYVIDVYDQDGRLVRRLSRVHTPVPITDDHVREYLRRAEAYYGSPNHKGMDLRSVEKKRASMPRVGFLPVTWRLLIDADNGTAWVERADLLSDPVAFEWTEAAPPRPSYWDVFDSVGVFQHMVRLPPRFTPRAIRADRIYGVLRDDQDVEYVVAYEVSRQ